MRKVAYSMTVSMDGYVSAPNGDMSWAIPDEQLHRYFNHLESRFDTHLYGRVMYEQMAAYWPAVPDDPDASEVEREYAPLWNAVNKVVFSSTLKEVGERARLVRGDFVAEIERLKAEPGKDISVGGASFAGACLQAGLVDECLMFVAPIVLGGGLPMFPSLEQAQHFRLAEDRRFDSGVIMLRYERA